MPWPETLTNNSAAARSSGLRRWHGHPATARLRLLCLPWCGAGASAYRTLARALPADIEVLAAQLPGREDRCAEAPLRRMAAVVDLLLAALAQLAPRPLVLLGHSMGAVVAHELAHALRLQGGPEPQLLVVSGHGAPTLAPTDGLRWHDADEARLLHYLGAMGGTPAAVLGDAALMRTVLPALRADYEVLETYRCAPRPPLACALVACAGTADTAVSASGLQAWRGLSSGPGLLRWFAGGHFYLRDDPAPFAQALRTWLGELPGRAGGASS